MSFSPPPPPHPPPSHPRKTRADHDLVGNTGSVDYLATGASTNGDYGLYRWNMGPEPSGPDAHFHKSLSESFFVLSGTIRLFDGSTWIDGRPGDYLYVPEGGLHGFRNESGEPASMLILFAPGAPREAYFEGWPRSGGTACGHPRRRWPSSTCGTTPTGCRRELLLPLAGLRA
jgi:mannose-6-phosphate isomerase-like protein (cupin superfamily)